MIIKDQAHIQNHQVNIVLLLETPPWDLFHTADLEADLLTFGGRDSSLSQYSCALASRTNPHSIMTSVNGGFFI